VVCSQAAVFDANYLGLSFHFGDQVNISKVTMVVEAIISVFFKRSYAVDDFIRIDVFVHKDVWRSGIRPMPLFPVLELH
jgi:hypothetical protein